MTSEESKILKELRDDVVELKVDMRWVKEWGLEHKKQHSAYTYYFVTLVIGMLIALIESFR